MIVLLFYECLRRSAGFFGNHRVFSKIFAQCGLLELFALHGLKCIKSFFGNYLPSRKLRSCRRQTFSSLS